MLSDRKEAAVHEPPPAKRARLAATADEVEPVFLHCPHKDFHEDEVTMSNASAILEFTTGPGYLLYAAVKKGIQAVGICMTDHHMKRADLHLLGMTLSAMATEGDDMYEPRLEALLKEHGDLGGVPGRPAGVQKPKGRA